MLGDPGEGQVVARIEKSLTRSLAALQLDRVDVFSLHSHIVPDGYVLPHDPEISARVATPWTRFVAEVRPAFETLVADGRIGAWGITGVALPRTIIDVIAADPAPNVVQCITNLLDATAAST